MPRRHSSNSSVTAAVFAGLMVIAARTGVAVASTSVAPDNAVGSSTNAAKAAAVPSATRSPSSVVEPSTGLKRLTEESMAQSLRKMEYAVRGKVVIAADRIADELAHDPKLHPYDHIVFTNIGNPHSVGQKPLTWPRQVLALCDLPDECGVNHPKASLLFPKDAIERAKEIKKGLKGHGTGAYSHSQGVRCFRDDIAKFIENRDGGVKANPENIFMTNGASSGIGMILTALIADETCGVMIPIPQYPIYSATIDMCGGHKVGYYLDEKSGWGLNMEEMERALHDAKAKGINVNSFVLINPGNPTGQVLSREQVHDILNFCARHKLVLLADEVYQENVYTDDAKFCSCKRAAFETGLLEDDAIELVSFHSTSKGIYGECGLRGGYMELVGFDPAVKDHIYKLASSGLCSGLSGQVMTSLMVRGPRPGDESYESHEKEKAAVFESLKRRAKIVSEGLDSIDGFSCQTAQGSMYCFPEVTMPEGAIKEAAAEGMPVDALYAISLLETTGICVVPASGFGQKSGRHGFRTTFLPPEEDMERAVGLIKKHYADFCSKYSPRSNL